MLICILLNTTCKLCIKKFEYQILIYFLDQKYLQPSIVYRKMNTLTYLLEKYPDKPWNWRWISMNPNITVDFIEKHPDKPWDWEGISMNPNITMEFIEKHSDKPWNWYFISRYQNITMDIIEKYKNWDYRCCSDGRSDISC